MSKSVTLHKTDKRASLRPLSLEKKEKEEKRERERECVCVCRGEMERQDRGSYSTEVQNLGFYFLYPGTPRVPGSEHAPFSSLDSSGKQMP